MDTLNQYNKEFGMSMEPAVDGIADRGAVATTSAPTKILVVDDVDANLVATRALLERPGVQVLTAASGPDALELLLAHDIALALLDVQMPGMDGYALAELMRGSARTRHVPIIFVTAGMHQPQGSFRGYEAGAVDYLYKPVDERVLRSKVAVFVELHRQRHALADQMAELARLSQCQALMLSALSHDLREPLAVLAMNAEVLLQRSETPALRQAATRQKAATAVLVRQVDHLINLARSPSVEMRVQPQATDLGGLLRRRWPQEAASSSDAAGMVVFGDTVGWWDAKLLDAAIEQILLQAEALSGGAPVNVMLDGRSRSAVSLSVRFARVPTDAAAGHVLGGGMSTDGLPAAGVGPGLRQAERIARAHGGSLVASALQREGTSFEMMLPRGAPGTTAAAAERADREAEAATVH